MFRAIAISALLSLLCSRAAADVVPPEPTNCPPGTVGRTCHGGPYCGVETCSATAPCKGTLTCQTTQFCIVQINCAGGWGGGPYYVDSVKGSCAGGAACKEGVCKTVQTCLPPPPPDSKVPQLDSKTTQPDGKAMQPDGKQPDSTAQGADTRSGSDAATSQPSRGCKCELDHAGAGLAPIVLLLFAAALLLCRRRRR